MVTWACRLLVIAAASLAAATSLAEEQSFDKRFNVQPGGHLTLDTDVGSVVVVGRDTQEVVIHAQMSDSDHLQITAEQNSSGVSVTGHVTQHTWFDWFIFTSVHVRYTIDVPRNYPVELKTSGGSLDVRNLTASVEGKTAGGSITVRDVTGSIDMHTSGGSITAERIKGTTKSRTSGGGIDIDDSNGDLDVHTSGGGIDLKSIDGKVKADTSGGSIHAEVQINRGVFLTTAGGSITLLLPENARASIDAQTSGGRTESALPLSSTELAERSHLRGAINGGGESIFLRTAGGSIHVEPLK
jgi:DUF4097 and DUF4098 domain-containing protein YvlB